MRSLSRVIRVLLVMGMACAAQLALATDADIHAIDISSQDLATALLEFATVTHQQIAFARQLVEGYKSSALSGTYTVADGLHALLGAAPFEIRTTPSGVLTLAFMPTSLRDAAVAIRRSAVTVNPTSAESESASLYQMSSEVVVSAERLKARAELSAKVSAFVEQITTVKSGSDGGLARWHVPICPLVAGLSRQEGEFILERVSEIAQAASVPLAGEKCRANLYILVADQPKELVLGMQQRNRIYTFGFDPFPAVVNAFIDTPRPVRVWYNWHITDAYNLPPGQADPGSVYNYAVIPHSDHSHLLNNIVYKFSHIFVIVDQKQLEGVSRGQLADYVGMVSLAEIDPTARLGDAQTILKLFAGAPQSAPAGLTDFDLAFLKSLYETDPRQKLQKSLIAREMVNEIIP